MNSTTNLQTNHSFNDDQPVIDLPRNYRGQKLTADSIVVAPAYSRKPIQHRELLSFLLKRFAVEMGCGKTARSRRYLQGLNSGQGYFWTHSNFPAISFVSLAQSEDGSVDRLLLVMPHEQMLRDFFKPAKVEKKVKQANDLGPLQLSPELTQQKHTLH